MSMLNNVVGYWAYIGGTYIGGGGGGLYSGALYLEVYGKSLQSGLTKIFRVEACPQDPLIGFLCFWLS